MKNLVLSYTGEYFKEAFNLGDDIQSIAAAKLMPGVDGFVNREELMAVDAPAVVSMNGYFMHSNNWPPSKYVIPVFYSFHITNSAIKTICSPEGIKYLQRWQPIGCRDRGTAEILKSYGVDAYFSKCVTLTFPKRKSSPQREGDVFIVGVEKKSLMRNIIPREIRRNAIHVDQAEVRLPIYDSKLKRDMAEEVLKQYEINARLVITTKIHCAMPCAAMGIPVVFLCDEENKDDHRIKLIEEILPVHYVRTSGIFSKRRNVRESHKINWNGSVCDIEDVKESIKEGFSRQYDHALATYLATQAV